MVNEFLRTHTTTWRSSRPTDAIVEVLQSSPSLLASLTKEPAALGASSTAARSTSVTARRRLFVLIPGNPGMVQFYEDFVRLMASKRDMDVLVMGLAGHSLENLNRGRLFTLQDQIDVADQFMHAVLDAPGAVKYQDQVYIGGHSIGGFVALQVLARHRERIQLYFGLCPVLSRIKASPNGQKMAYWDVVVLQWLAAFLGSLFALLPCAARRAFVKWNAPTLVPSLQEAIACGVNRSILMNVFYLSFDEFRCVIQPDTQLLRRVQDKMCLYYVPEDGWAPPKHAEEIQSVCPLLKSYTMEADKSVPHAWCLAHTAVIIERAIDRFIGS